MPSPVTGSQPFFAGKPSTRLSPAAQPPPLPPGVCANYTSTLNMEGGGVDIYVTPAPPRPSPNRYLIATGDSEADLAALLAREGCGWRRRRPGP